jgi:hypothetical protein
MANRLHIGDTNEIVGIETRRRSTDALVDPTTFTCLVLPPSGASFSLVWGMAPSSGTGDAVIRTAVGTFTIQIALTTERGVGLYRYTIVTTGAVAAEPGAFRVEPRAI